MSWSAAMVASLRSAVDQPRWWLIGLASFLVRGGVLVFLLPIVILPTPAGLTNALAPSLVGFVFGSPSPSFVALVEALVAAVLAWLLGGGLVAAWLDVMLIGEVVESPSLGMPAGVGFRTAWRSLVIRLTCHLPLALALARGVLRLVDAVYAELITPGDVAIPIVIRVVLRIPDVFALILGAWLAGEAAGGLAARHLALHPERSAFDALGRGWLDLLTRPSTLATLLLTTVAVLAVLAPVAAVDAFAWRRVWAVLADGRDPIVVALTLASFVAIWLAGVGLTAVAVAWRSAAWTFESARRDRARTPLRPSVVTSPA